MSSLKTEITFLNKHSKAHYRRHNLLVCIASVKTKRWRLEKLFCSKVDVNKNNARSHQYTITVGNREVLVKTVNNRVDSLYKEVATFLKVDGSDFILFSSNKIVHQSYCNTLPQSGTLLKCHFKLNAGGHTTPTSELAHPGKKCNKCAQCGVTSTTRWYHKVRSTDDFIKMLKETYGLTKKSCICSKCNNIIEGTTKCKKSQVNKRKAELQSCIVCGDVGQHNCYIDDTELFVLKFGLPECPQEANLCSEHYTMWSKRNVPRCDMPDCGITIRDGIRCMNEYNCRLPNEHFKVHNDYSFFTLKTSHDLCVKCYRKLYNTIMSCDKSHVLSNSADLQCILTEHEHTFSEMKKSMPRLNYKAVALEYTIIHVAKHLRKQDHLILSEVRNYFF